MKYALLAYDLDATLDQLAREDKRALHQGHTAPGERLLGDGIRLIAHYRFRPPALATTIRIGTDGAIRRQGPASTATATLRALYILESDDPEQARPTRKTTPRNPARRDNRDLAAQRAALLTLDTHPAGSSRAPRTRGC
jgi:hypothetical protein